MNIIFSDHAKLRCKQQNIAEQAVRRQLKNIPDFYIEIRWVINEAVIKLKKVSDNSALVVTLTLQLDRKRDMNIIEVT